ncbi:MAG: hypothetical protein ABW022_25200 [Actinoplanes sp.]
MTVDLSQLADGERVTVTGTLSNIVERTSKQGRAWVSADITVDGQTVELLVFPDEYEQLSNQISDGASMTVEVSMSRFNSAGRLYTGPPRRTTTQAEIEAFVRSFLASRRSV